jgi:hypothetical protein
LPMDPGRAPVPVRPHRLPHDLHRIGDARRAREARVSERRGSDGDCR